MPDFSDKYKKALEYQEISPDFKERTAKLMSELRDSEEPVLKTAEKNEAVTKQINVSDNGFTTSRRIKLVKMISTVAAAAACLTVGVALNNAGIFNEDSDPSVISDRSLVTEATDIIETDEKDFVSEADLSTEVTTVSELEITAALETIAENVSENKAETATETFAVTEETTNSDAPSAAFFSMSEQIPAEEAYEENSEEIIEEIPVEAAPADAEEIELPEYDSDKIEVAHPLETVLILEPFSDDTEEAAEAESVEGESAEDEEIVEEDSAADITSASDMSRAASFSPKSAVSEFPAQSSTAVITPEFEDINSEDGTVMTYEPKEVRSVSKLLTLNKELYAYAEEGEASLAAEAPSDSRYIIDYADKQGNGMRIYMGSRYICFAYGGYFYTFELTEEEYNALDSVLFGLVT